MRTFLWLARDRGSIKVHMGFCSVKDVCRSLEATCFGTYYTGRLFQISEEDLIVTVFLDP